MRVVVTGTPGTGKTTATERLASRLDGFEVVHLNALLEREGLYTDVDDERDSLIADLDALAARLANRDDVVVESHLAHLLDLDVDRVAVLRCAPADLEARLRERGEHAAKARENAERTKSSRALARSARENAERTKSSRALARSARENAESEALDVILAEAVDRHGPDAVYEIDTTDRDPDAVADCLAAVVRGERDPSAGEVDFVGYLS